MPFDPNLPYQLNDGTKVQIVEIRPNMLRVRVPEGHPLDDPGCLIRSTRNFALDGTRNLYGNTGPFDYWLVNIEPQPTPQAVWHFTTEADRNLALKLADPNRRLSPEGDTDIVETSTPTF